MPPWATRLLHVPACAPVIAVFAISLAPVAHAQDAAPPTPYVVAVDPGHGGLPDNAHPELPFDSGAIGIDGALEKDLTLDIARRVRSLMEADMVSVVMTRDSDSFVSIGDRSKIGEDAHASLFVSVHLNSWTDSSVGGSLVLFPAPGPSQAFAAVMSTAVGKRLQPFGVEPKGTELRDNWWIHSTMPVVTVEGAYVTNPGEAALLAKPGFRDTMALGIHDGMLAQDPTIAKRKGEILAWNRDHPSSPVGVPQKAASGSWMTAVPAVLAVALLGLVARYRRPLMQTVLTRVEARRGHGLPPRHLRQPGRGRQVRRRVQPVTRPHSVYDDLWF